MISESPLKMDLELSMGQAQYLPKGRGRGGRVPQVIWSWVDKKKKKKKKKKKIKKRQRKEGDASVE
ncbi:hypothetical protein N7539_003636 [Penicillium diatomitis]|uniref:Uncharacterized protein n=1 Tax=Penicillium diatomitis TaxID=2819901 RepID=A0A9W9XCP1_9EURO|nr:uncharacterized protein N7539_003636 [Penicillium diatomitis]KAJ5488746.1 hypothetical protein N7539_003636 [Penicillium diatomitis]